MQDGRIEVSSRRLLKALAGTALLMPIERGRPVAVNDWAIFASTSWLGAVDFWADEGDEALASHDPGTIVQFLDGPASDDRYFVDPIHLADVPPGSVRGSHHSSCSSSAPGQPPARVCSAGQVTGRPRLDHSDTGSPLR